MRKFESSQKDESRAQLADSSKAYKKRRAFYCQRRWILEFKDRRQALGKWPKTPPQISMHFIY